MIDFVGKPPFLRITLRVVMRTMHFHIAQTGLFLENILFYAFMGFQGTFGTNENCPRGAR